MAEGLGEYQTLHADDVTDVFEELLPAQIKTYELGLKLKLPQHEVESIHSMYSKPRDRLLQILIEFLNQGGVTWKIIVEALRSATVNLPALAKKVAAAHPDCNIVSDTSPQEPVNDKHLDVDTEEIEERSTPVDPVKVTVLEADIGNLHERFNLIKEMTIAGLEKCCLSVVTVVFLLTNIRTVNEHKVFLKENHKALRQCEDHLELFGSLNFYWNYLAYDLLDHLINELAKKHKYFHTVAGEMTVYKKDLEDFRKRTALVVFCETEPPMLEDPPAGFRKIVFRVDWPKRATLDDAENFRRKYARCYDLPTCAIMLAHVGIGSFFISYFVPSQVPSMELSSATSVPPVPKNTHESIVVKESNVEEVYRFAEEPEQDYFCPVSMGLLLHPHLTSCCGNHLSREAANRLQTDGNPCPLCKQKSWSTVLNKHFQRQVNSLHVFCCHENRGCGWQGEVCAFHNHVQSCPMKDCPILKDLKFPMYYESMLNNGTQKKLICRAIYDYEPGIMEESAGITLKKGDTLEIIARNNKDLWLARCLETGEKGYVSSSNVTPIWLFASLQRLEAESLLMAHREKGMFLIRKSQSKIKHLALSIYDGLDVCHFHIYHYHNHEYFMDEWHKFASLVDLVDYYSENLDGLPLKLGTPCPPDTPTSIIEKDDEIEESPRESITLFPVNLSKKLLWSECKGTWNDVTVQCTVSTTRNCIEPQSFKCDIIRIMKKLHHPNIVEFYTFSTEREMQIIITEYVSELNLLQYIRGKGRVLKLTELVSMAAQIAFGMSYLEQNNYVHGDLAACNVMVGEGNICKIKNYGLSRLIYNKRGHYLDITETNYFRVKWMAPEVALQKQFSVKSDVWSFGVLLYEIFTYGQVPYPGMSHEEVIELIMKGYRLHCPLHTPMNIYDLVLGTWKEKRSNRLTFEYLHSALEEYFFNH